VKIYHVIQIKMTKLVQENGCMVINSLTHNNKILFQTSTHNTAAKTSWHRYGTKLRHCQPLYTVYSEAATIYCHTGQVVLDTIRRVHEQR